VPIRAAFGNRNLPGSLVLPLDIIVLPFLALMALQAYQAFGRAAELARSRELVAHTFEVISTAQALKSALQDAERGQSGYVLTGESPYLDAYRSGIGSAPALLAKLRALTPAAREQQRRMPILAEQIDVKLREMQRTLTVYSQQGYGAAQQIIRTNVGLDAMRTIEGIIDADIAGERELLAQRLAAVAQAERNTTYIVLASGLLTFALMIAGIVLALRAFREARDREAARLDTERRLSEELAQAQAAFAQTQKMEALGQLTGGVAHDFNNLLHIIKNAVTIAQRRLRTDDVEVRRYLDMVQRNTDLASSTTARLLAFSRQQPLDPRPTDINKLVLGMSELLRHVLGEAVSMETVLGSGLWAVSMDRNQLETSILNLALNARDAMPGGGKLTLETANVFLDESYVATQQDVAVGQYAMLAVSDTGVGMTEEVIARAFEPFFTTKESGRGTGLGLSQVFGFIKQSDGHVKIYSEPGQGTTVKLYLPRLAGAALDQATQAGPAPFAGSGESILVVEDNEDVRAFTAQVLEELGYRVSIAADGHAALKLLEEQSGVDLLFTDVGLPHGINGRELAAQTLRRWPRVRVLYTTGYARNSIVHHGRLDPGVELITKPFTQSSLAAKVRQLLDKDASRGGASG
jgi:signal transduction histidine kinase/ActR/RegA family two-component response regulator